MPVGDTAQHVMLLRLAALAANEIANLILGPDAAAATEDQVSFLAHPSTVAEVFNGLDVNHGGIVTPAEIFSFAAAGTGPVAAPTPTLLGGFLAAVKV